MIFACQIFDLRNDAFLKEKMITILDKFWYCERTKQWSNS